jgi:hypothetical protein
MRGSLLACLTAVICAGCGDDVIDTIVDLQPGGAGSTFRVVSRAQIEAEMQVRAQQQAPDPTSDCGPASLWIFDAAVSGHYTRRLCLSGTGTVSLSPAKTTPPDPALPSLGDLSWPYTVASFWAGGDKGLFSHPNETCAAVRCDAQNFKPWQAWTNLAAGYSIADVVTLYRLQPFASGGDNVHQFVVADGNIPMPSPTTDAPLIIAALLQPVSATQPQVDFVWSGDQYPNCWAGDKTTCGNLPQSPQKPVIGHYNPMTGVASDGGYGRCVDDSDCPSPSPAFNPSADGTTFHCGKLTPPPGTTEQPRMTTLVGLYVDAAGNQESVCMSNQRVMTLAEAEIAEWSYWRRSQTGWLLYTAKNDSAANVPWEMGYPPFDISNRDVVKEMVGRMARWPHLRDYYGAIALDVVFPANIQGARYTCQIPGGPNGTGGCPNGGAGWSTPVAPSSGALKGRNDYGSIDCATGYCDPAWTELVLQLLTRLRDEVHKLDMNLVINIGYSGSGTLNGPTVLIPPTDMSLLKIFDTVDGVFDEGGFTLGHAQADYLTYEGANNDCYAVSWRFDGGYRCGPVQSQQLRWSDYLGYMQSLQSHSKPYFSKSNAFGPLTETDRYNNPSPEPVAIDWTLASFLMARGTSSTLTSQSIYMGDVYYDTDPSHTRYDLAYVPPGSALFTSLNPQIGHPCEDPQPGALPHVLTRKYSHGFAAVNANPVGSGVDSTVQLPWDPAQVPLPAGNGLVKTTASTVCP